MTKSDFEESDNVDTFHLVSSIFDSIEGLEQRKVYLFGDVTTESILIVVRQIHILEKRSCKKDIELIINSDGGEVQDCLALIDAMDSSPCDIHTVVLGRAASAACLIASNGTLGKRFGGRNSEFMFHEGYESIEDAKSSHMAYYKTKREKLEKKFNGIFAKNTGRSIKEIEDKFFSEELDVWVYVQEAKGFGIIDRILLSTKSKKSIEKKKGRSKK